MSVERHRAGAERRGSFYLRSRTISDFVPATLISPLRQRLIDDMNMRRFSRETQRNYIRDMGRFATFLGRAPNTARTEDLRRFQIDQPEAGVPVPPMNAIVLGAAVLLYAHPRPARPRAQAGPGDSSAQAAGGAEHRRFRELLIVIDADARTR